MLKVKKTTRNPKNKSQDDNLTELQNDIKNSIKNLYISDQKNKQRINEYAELLTKIRNEYPIDGIPTYEPDSPTEEEQEEDNNFEIQNKYKGKQPKEIE